MRPEVAAGLALLVALAAAPARAEEGVTRERLEALERRIAELEAEREERLAREAEEGLGDWTRRVRLSGSANAGYFAGSDRSVFDDTSFQVWDARFFLDADLGRDVVLGERPILRNLGLSFEWNLVRLGKLQNDVGELYVDFQGVLGAPWLNVQVGRFYIPFGENYLRFGRNYRDNPFITNTVGGPWWWDEGVRIYGSTRDGRFGWVASVSDGESEFAEDGDRDPQATLKLYGRPTSWLYLSASVLGSGGIGSDEIPAQGAVWLGEAWARQVGDWADVPTFVDGAEVANAPPTLDHTWMAGVDAVLTHETFGRLWLAYGLYDIDAGASLYDRRLHYWIAEWVLQGRALAPELTPFYLALRGSGLGSYDGDEGYLLDVRQSDTIGYNAESLTVYSLAIGWRINRHVTIRSEYGHQEIELVHGVPREIRRHGGGADFFGVEVGASF
ncbi:MAG TPA: hypothetical protein VLC53_06485 [Myxococcota bacterium]|nr:hypothetical protein [Myxococcota bacterium]